MFFVPVLSLSLAVARAWALPASSATNDTASSIASRAAAVTIPPQLFSANASHQLIKRLTAAATSGNHSRAEYSLWHGSAVKSTIYGDWSHFADSSAYYFVADMDVDCDGIDYECEGNPDGLNVTDWGALSAYAVPWIVIPYSFINKPDTRDQLVGNNVAAVICKGKMFYGIFGDSNGDKPEVIGEASWLLARTCFPEEGLSGAVGHGKADVTYIVFNTIVPDIGWSYLHNFDALRSIGDMLISRLASNLGLLT